MKRWMTGLAGIVLTAALIAPQALAEDPPAEKAKPAAIDAASIYTAKCAACHGVDGKGNPGLGSRDFTDAALMDSRTDEQLFNVIRDGGLAHGLKALMPAFKGQISDEEIKALVAHIRAMKPTK